MKCNMPRGHPELLASKVLYDKKITCREPMVVSNITLSQREVGTVGRFEWCLSSIVNANGNNVTTCVL